MKLQVFATRAPTCSYTSDYSSYSLKRDHWSKSYDRNILEHAMRTNLIYQNGLCSKYFLSPSLPISRTYNTFNLFYKNVRLFFWGPDGIHIYLMFQYNCRLFLI